MPYYSVPSWGSLDNGVPSHAHTIVTLEVFKEVGDAKLRYYGHLSIIQIKAGKSKLSVGRPGIPGQNWSQNWCKVRKLASIVQKQNLLPDTVTKAALQRSLHVPSAKSEGPKSMPRSAVGDRAASHLGGKTRASNLRS